MNTIIVNNRKAAQNSVSWVFSSQSYAMNIPAAANEIVQAHISILKSDAEKIGETGGPKKLPFFSEETITQLLNTITPFIKDETNVLDIYLPVVVIGDLHGHIYDLYRILNKLGLPPKRNYLFLGDLIDRGEFSIELVTFVLALKTVFPRNVFIIRGNHEFENSAIKGGFYTELQKTYKSPSLFKHFIDTFSYLPIAAKLFGQILCVHAGISPNFRHLDQLNGIKRPIIDDNDSLLSGIFWSDPTDMNSSYGTSHRGVGFSFGSAALSKFLSNNDLTLMIRGHECVPKGYEVKFGKRLVTVFSASNYCGCSGNDCAVLAVFGPNDFEPITFPVLQTYIKRSQVSFVKYNPEEFSVKEISTIAIPRNRFTKSVRPMRILATSRLSIPIGHPLFAQSGGFDKLKMISRIRDVAGTSRAVTRFGTI